MHKVESTTDYKKFKTMEGNRPVGKRINRLVRQIKRKNMLAQFPILCVKNGSGLYIADGQHRFEAAKALNLPVFYVEAKNISIEDIAQANSEQKAWNMYDYMASWIARGNKHYAILKRLSEEYLIPISTAIIILGDTSGGTSMLAAFREGRFVARNLVFAERIAQLIRAMRPYLTFAFDRSLGVALVYLNKVQSFDAERFIHKLSTCPVPFHKCASWQQYVDLIEEIYNFRVRSNQLVPLAIEAKKLKKPSGHRNFK